MKTNDTQQVTICGKKLHGLRHICAFFESDQEMYEVVSPYLKEGLDGGDQVVTIMESKGHPSHKASLQAAGLDVNEAMERNQLRILASEDTYIKDNVFVVERMFDMLREAILGAEKGEFKHIRTMGDMYWALRNCPGTDDLMMYEARVNQLAPLHDCTLLCAYDLNQFSGRVIADVLATHSHVILGGQIHENPYYVDPVVYLHKLASRRVAQESTRN